MNAMLGDLPTWNLSDLYSSPGGPDLDADLKRAAADAESFAKAYEGKVAGMDGKALGAAVAKFEALNDLMGRIASYASLYYAQDMADPERGRFSQDISQALTDIGAREFGMLAVLALASLWMGVQPKPFTDVMHASVVNLLQHVAQTKLFPQ